jgi:hypothetical protein
MGKTGALRRAALAGALALLGAAATTVPPAAVAQPSRPAADDVVPCVVSVAFEPIGVRTTVPQTNALHALVVVGPTTLNIGFEGHHSGTPVGGWLIARRRNLATSPLRDGTSLAPAGVSGLSCGEVARRLAAMVGQINAARLPYSPTPEFAWNTVNSNSFTFWAVSRLNLRPPMPPGGWHSGVVPGYHAAIAGGGRN